MNYYFYNATIKKNGATFSESDVYKADDTLTPVVVMEEIKRELFTDWGVEDNNVTINQFNRV